MIYPSKPLRRDLSGELTPSQTEEAIISMIQDAGFGDMLLPGLMVTSAHRDLPPTDFHTIAPYTAVDFGSDGSDGQADKDTFAAWLYNNFWNQAVELIHELNPDTDAGYYVKNYQRVGSSFYGDITDDAHLNHVHLAMTLSDVNDMRNTPEYQSAVAQYQAYLKAKQQSADIM